MLPEKKMEYIFVNSEGLMATSVTKGGTQKLPKYLRSSKPTDMTIHWKALEEHFLTVPFIVVFWGGK
jgi:hypothetical protein